MITMSSQKVARMLQAEHRGDEQTFTGMHNDSRKLNGGELYVAVRGENQDGHQYVVQAQAQGAKAVLVDTPVDTRMAQIVCADTVNAMGTLASFWRKQHTPLVVALTGSNGKTTVKEMLAAIFDRSFNVLVTEGNLNNHIGVPLTLARLSAEHQVAIIEMGANHEKEIDYLTHIVRPDIALVNNAAPAHLEGFGDLQGVARGKGEIYAGLNEDGTGVVNADDAFADYWRGLLAGKTVVSFGMEKKATISGTYAAGRALRIKLDGQSLVVDLTLAGRHNAMNALAACACAHAAGLSLVDMQNGLHSVKPVAGRMQNLQGIKKAKIINDSYNANPASLHAALEWFAAQPGKRILVLGDMFELGHDAQTLHRQCGEAAKSAGMDHVLAIGEFASAVVEGFGDQGHHFSDYDSLIAQLIPMLDADTSVLIKGSRGMHMETVTQAITKTGS